MQAQLSTLDSTTTDAGFIAGLANLAPGTAFQDELSRVLPLPQGESSFIYFDAERLAQVYNTETLSAARDTLRESFQNIEIDPLNASMALLPNGRYLTRLYTTMSADDMTLDPTFDYNSQMGDQSAERRATLSAACGDNGTEWTLTLGAGTGRDGEVVIDAQSEIPFGPVPVEVSAQEATFTLARTTAAALPDITAQNDFTVVEINGGSSGSLNGGTEDGGSSTSGSNSSADGGSGGMSWHLWLLALFPIGRWIRSV